MPEWAPGALKFMPFSGGCGGPMCHKADFDPVADYAGLFYFRCRTCGSRLVVRLNIRRKREASTIGDTTAVDRLWLDFRTNDLPQPPRMIAPRGGRTPSGLVVPGQ